MSVVANFATTATDGKTYVVEFYNLDMILSIGYRVKSKRGIQFRRWANSILKQYLLSGCAINNRLVSIEGQLREHRELIDNHDKKIDFFVRTSMPPVEGIFFDGQIYDAHSFVSNLIRKAKQRIILIDNYVDDTVLTLLDKRSNGVEAAIYTCRISKQLQLDIDRHNSQYPPVQFKTFSKSHDRFIIIDDKVYLIGASIKDLGKKWFGFTLMKHTTAAELLTRLSK